MNFDFLTFELLCVIWFLLLGVLLIGYAILDGFDLGVGILHPFVAKSDHERRLTMNSIGPLWDGNEVWLITFGGAMFAMFPMAYASIFSGFYTAFMLLLFALISRAVSMEFRSKMKGNAWRSFWDWMFFTGSFLATLLFGVAIGNVMRGIELDQNGNFVSGLLSHLNPFSLIVGLLAVSVFALHGTLYLFFKVENGFQARLEKSFKLCFTAFLILYLATTIFALLAYSHIIINFLKYPVLWIVPVLHILAIISMPRALNEKKYLKAFFASALNITALVALIGIGLFPYLIISPEASQYSLNIYNAASSLKTLRIGLLIVILGMPCVLAYTAVIYWAFRGKVKLDAASY